MPKTKCNVCGADLTRKYEGGARWRRVKTFHCLNPKCSERGKEVT